MSEQNETALTVATPQAPAAPVAGATMWGDPALMRETFQMAQMLSESSIIPDTYRGKPGNCIIAMDMANRMGISPLTVMQNLHVIQGKPTWSGSACKAMVDGCGRFRSSRYEFVGKEGTDSYGCRLVAERVSTGEVVRGELITIAMAKKEGWYNRSGSKWPSMPGQMLRYRAAAFFARTECAEFMMGLQTDDEAADVARVSLDAPEVAFVCEECGQAVTPTEKAGVKTIVEHGRSHYGRTLCADCQRALKRKPAQKPAEPPVDAPPPDEWEDTAPAQKTQQDENTGEMEPL